MKKADIGFFCIILHLHSASRDSGCEDSEILCLSGRLFFDVFMLSHDLSWFSYSTSDPKVDEGGTATALELPKSSKYAVTLLRKYACSTIKSDLSAVHMFP